MITKETAERVWACHREIETGKQLLENMEEAEREARDRRDPHAENLKDAFGRPRLLQLGIPCGQSAHRLLDVSPKLAKSIIRAHIANKEAELAEANEQARVESSKDSTLRGILAELGTPGVVGGE